jgi:hypothetical protein
MLRGERPDSQVVALTSCAGQLVDIRRRILPTTLRVRFVRVRLGTGDYEVLTTSLLDEARWPTADYHALYSLRWGVEIFFRILKSGCCIEELQIETRERLEPTIALYMLIAWRMLDLTNLGRECPELPCPTSKRAVFAEEEWKAVYLVTQKQAPPEQPPSLDTMVHMLASLGGFLNRKCDGFPGPKTLWIGLQRIPDFVRRALEAHRSVRDRYG